MTTFKTLWAWRLRYYAAATLKLMLRRWQAAVLVLGLLSPALMPLGEQLGLLGAPVLALVRPGPVVPALALWTGALLSSWLWSSMQSDAISGGEGWRFLCLQPVPASTRRAVDLAMLVATDLPLWLPFAAALASLLVGSGAQAGWRAAAVAALAAQLPLCQGLAGKRRATLALTAGLQLLGIALVKADLHPAWLLACLLAAAAAAALWCPPRQPRATAPLPPPLLRLSPTHRPGLNLLLIDLRFMADPAQRSKHVVLALIAPLPPLLLWLCLAWQIRPGPTLLIITLPLVPLVFQVAGRLFDLRHLHAPLRAWLRSMGVSRWRLLGIDIAVLAQLYLLAAIPLAAALYVASRSLVALSALPIGMACVVAMSWLNQFGDHQMFLPKAALAVGAVWLVVRLVPV